MNITVNATSLHNAMALLCTVARRNPRTILEYVCLELGRDCVTLCATNMDVSLRIDVPIIRDGIREYGSAVCIQAAWLLAALKGKKGDVTLITEGADVTVQVGGALSSATTMSCEDFPVVQFNVDAFANTPATPVVDVTFESAVLRDAIARVLPAMARTDEVRSSLQHIRLQVADDETCVMEASDGRRHHRVMPRITAIRSIANMSVYLSGTSAGILLKMLAPKRDAPRGVAVLRSSGIFTSVTVGGQTLMNRADVHRYPDIEKYVPTGYGISARFDGVALARALALVPIIQIGTGKDRETMPVRLEIAGGQITLAVCGENGRPAYRATAPGMLALDTCPADYIIAVNPTYLADGVKAAACAGGEITLQFVDPLQMVRLDGNGFRGLIMPVRIKRP